MSDGAGEVHDELLEVLRGFLAKHDATGGTGLAVDRSWWRQLTDLGVFGLAVGEDDGGFGLGLEAAVRAFEVLGEARAPGPLVWTQLAALELPDALSGEWVVAGIDLTAQDEADPIVVPHLDAADRLLVLEERGLVLYRRDEVDAVALAAPIDPDTPVARVGGFSGGEVIGDPARAAVLRRTGTLLTAALLVGTSETATRVAVDYAQGRHQFGRPIGSFQALKHLLADCYTRTSLARAAVYAAAELERIWEPGSPGFDLSAAKLLAGQAADANARTAVQVFGGMGFAWETPPHLLLKRTWLLEHEFGTMQEHSLAVADLIVEAV